MRILQKMKSSSFGVYFVPVFIVFIAMVLTASAFISDPMPVAEAYFGLSGSCYETECMICGKTISKWSESSSGDYFISGGYDYCTGPDIVEMAVEAPVCAVCYDKHYPEMQGYFDTWILSLQEDYKVVRQQYNQDRHDKAVVELNEEISERQRKLERLNQ